MHEKEIDAAFELRLWLGRRQVFRVMGGRCTAADALCLQTIRDNQLYRVLNMTWEEFCRKLVGVSRPVADRILRHFEEFGTGYFELAAVTGVTPQDYRLIAGAVSEQGVAHAGETIPILPENAPRLIAAIKDLHQ